MRRGADAKLVRVYVDMVSLSSNSLDSTRVTYLPLPTLLLRYNSNSATEEALQYFENELQ